MIETLAFKDPNEVLDYVLTWTAVLGSDTISTSTWTIVVTDDAVTKLVIDSDSHTTTTTTVWLSAGTQGQSYDLLNRIITAGGRTLDRSARILIKEK